MALYGAVPPFRVLNFPLNNLENWEVETKR
jgi:hypothetical protein